MPTSPPFSHAAVIGIGLIGASIIHAAKHRQLPVSFTAYDNNPDVREQAANLLPHAKITSSLQQAVADADLVILAIPVGVMEQVMKEMAPYLQSGCVITDTGSTKRSVIRDVSPLSQKRVISFQGTLWLVQNFQALQLDLPAYFSRAIGCFCQMGHRKIKWLVWRCFCLN